MTRKVHDKNREVWEVKPDKEKGEETWIDTMLNLYSQGLSDIEVLAEMRVPKRKFEEYMKSKDFREIVETGRMLSEAYWLKMGRVGAQSKGSVDSAIWSFNMQNRFGWASKQDTRAATVEVSDISLEEMRRVVASALPNLINDPRINQHLLEQAEERDET